MRFMERFPDGLQSLFFRPAFRSVQAAGMAGPNLQHSLRLRMMLGIENW
jgi:hypothetical protein